MITKLETGVDREPTEFAERLREIADEIDNGGVVHAFEEHEAVEAEEMTEITVALKYTPTID